MVVGGEANVADFETFSDNSVDHHCLFGTGFHNADSDFVHVTVVLFLFLSFLWFLFLLVLEIGGGFDVREKVDLILAVVFAQFDESIFLLDSPALCLELVLEFSDVGETRFFCLDLALKDAGKGDWSFLNFAGEVVFGIGEEGN